MPDYYAIERSPDYLEHYGIKGMKWGIRKAIESGNSRALSRQYRKAQKKLAKLEKQAANGKKYAKRAAALGVGAAAAGGLAAAGTAGVSRLVRKAGSTGAQIGRATGGLMERVGDAAYTYARTPGNRNTTLGKWGTRYGKQLRTAGQNLAKNSHNAALAGRHAGTAITSWGNSTSISDAAEKAIRSASFNGSRIAGARNLSKKVHGISNNTIARIGAGAIGAGLAGAAGYNAYRAATTKEAARKPAEFRREMNKALAGTKYGRSNGGNRQGKKRRR
jgi:hypothetical protein